VVSEAAGEPSAERVDQVIEVFSRIVDGGRRDPDAERRDLSAFTPAEVVAAVAILRGEADSAGDTVMAIVADPGGPAATLSQIVHASEPDPFDGLPSERCWCTRCT
jgi:hypothetical protein